MRRLKIFIVTHGPIYEELFLCDPTFDPSLFVILKVGARTVGSSPMQIPTVHVSDLTGFIPIGPQWAETEAIYAVFKTAIYNHYDMIGFIHYDYRLSVGFCDEIKQIAADGRENFVSFSSFSFDDDYKQHIILDPKRPDVLQAKGGPNCYHTLIKHYNEVYGTNLCSADLSGKRINLCSAYFCSLSTYIDLMRIIDYSITARKLDGFDPKNKFRLQGGMAERYCAIYSSQIDFRELELCHEYQYYKKYL